MKDQKIQKKQLIFALQLPAQSAKGMFLLALHILNTDYVFQINEIEFFSGMPAFL
jgi:hypothetical protein